MIDTVLLYGERVGVIVMTILFAWVKFNDLPHIYKEQKDSNIRNTEEHLAINQTLYELKGAIRGNPTPQDHRK